MRDVSEMATMILCLGMILIVAIMTQEIFSRFRFPALVGYIVIGILLSVLNEYVNFIHPKTENIIHFLAEVGVIVLLFHVGLESKLHKLLKQIWRATAIGIISVFISAAFGFIVSYYLLSLDSVVSMIIAAAMVATSIGVSAGIWEENKAIETNQGQLLMDIAELDDIIGVIVLALLFALIPIMTARDSNLLAPRLVKTIIPFAAKFVLFGLACILFSRFAEKPLSDFLQNLETPPEETLTIFAMGLIIAAFAGMLGFSVAIGAFFGGLIFSRDPGSVKEKTVVNVIYNLFVPFFFIGIGLKMQIDTLNAMWLPASLLIVAAFLGKFVGTLAPAFVLCDQRHAVLLGISMVPRAEITMIIMQQSLQLPNQPVPDRIYSAMVIVCIASCVIPALLLNRLIGQTVKVP